MFLAHGTLRDSVNWFVNRDFRALCQEWLGLRNQKRQVNKSDICLEFNFCSLSPGEIVHETTMASIVAEAKVALHAQEITVGSMSRLHLVGMKNPSTEHI